MKKFLMILLGIIVIAACKKDEPPVVEPPVIEPPVEPVVYPEYGNLKVGNYWIYQHYHIDTNGIETPLDKFDTCYIENDTVIGEHTYFKMIRPRISIPKFGTYYWREFEGVIYDRNGKVHFSAEDFTTIFETRYSIRTNGDEVDTLYVVTSMMVDKDKNIITPAGNFLTRTYQAKYELADWFSIGMLKTRFSNTRYTRDIGIVSETLEIYASDPTYKERRLVSWGTK